MDKLVVMQNVVKIILWSVQRQDYVLVNICMETNGFTCISAETTRGEA